MLGRLEAGQHQRDVAQAMGVSLTTLKKWVRRYRAEGPAGLLDRPCRPRCSPRQLCSERIAQVIALRQQRRTGRFICQRLGVSSASVSRILRRARLSRWRDLEPRPPVLRYERERPGELLHLDTKKLARINGIGHRIHGDRQLRRRGVGWDFVHVAIDDASRVSRAQIACNEWGDTASAFLRDTVRHFRERGVRIERVMTDNGSAYVSLLLIYAVLALAALPTLGIDPNLHVLHHIDAQLLVACSGAISAILLRPMIRHRRRRWRNRRIAKTLDPE